MRPKGGADWSRVKAGLDRLLEERPTDWNLNAAANLACHAKDRAAAADLLARLGDRIVETQWSEWRAPQACRTWLTSPRAASTADGSE